MGRSKRTKVFISYSHQDKAALQRLRVHLAPLAQAGLDLWDDSKIDPGAQWREEIRQALDAARVAILLVSADFLASEFIATDELPKILVADEQEGLTILPVILWDCRFKRTPKLKDFQTVNPPSKPLLEQPRGEQERIWAELSNTVEDILKADVEAATTSEPVDTSEPLSSSKSDREEGAEAPSVKSPKSTPTQFASVVDLTSLTIEAYEAEVEGDTSKARQLWEKVLSLKSDDPKALAGLQRLGEETQGPESYLEDLGGGVKLEMLAIPDGGFWMGSPEREEGRDDYKNWDSSLADVNVEGPQHRVNLQTFWMGKYPVTQAQWLEVAAFPKVKVDLKPQPSKFFGLDRPVESITWFEAIEFCARLSQYTGKNYRLPSEAEWEYACRAGTITPFSFGETISTDLANYCGIDREIEGNTYPGFYGEGSRGEFLEKTTKVGIFPANAWGLHDMHGNVWEWCADHWHKNYDSTASGGTPWIKGGEEGYRVLRGGSWYSVRGTAGLPIATTTSRTTVTTAMGFV